jgi:hypothetical protein
MKTQAIATTHRVWIVGSADLKCMRISVHRQGLTQTVDNPLEVRPIFVTGEPNNAIYPAICANSAAESDTFNKVMVNGKASSSEVFSLDSPVWDSYPVCMNCPSFGSWGRKNNRFILANPGQYVSIILRAEITGGSSLGSSPEEDRSIRFRDIRLKCGCDVGSSWATVKSRLGLDTALVKSTLDPFDLNSIMLEKIRRGVDALCFDYLPNTLYGALSFSGRSMDSAINP